MPEEESSLEHLQRNLYSRNENLVPKEKRTPVSPREVEAPKDWGTKPNFNITSEEMARKNNSFFNKFLVGSLAFFLVSLGIALFIFFGGLNMISSNNLDIKVTAPSSVSSGEELLASLSIVNTNRTDLEDAILYIDYPEGSQTVGEKNDPILHDKVSLGTIAKGGVSDYTLRALVFGEKDAVKTFKFRIEYKVKGSNAIFSKEKTYEVLIGSSPLLLDVNYPKEVNSGQIVELSIDVTSNSSVPLKNALVKIEYPYGFTYKDSSIKPIRDNSVWNIGDIKNGDKKTITVRGIMVGQNMEDRSFRVMSGVQSVGQVGNLDTALADSIITIGIRKSFFDLGVYPINGNVLRVGDSAPVQVRFKNTLPDKILNSKIEVAFSGNAFDRNRVTVGDGGYYQSVNNTLVWDKNGNNNLGSISPGDEGRVSFNVGSIGDFNIARQIKNPHIDIHVTMSGDRAGTDTSNITSTEDLTIKISSVMNVVAKSHRDTGPFSNTGPIPPKSDTESTYTVTWTVTNTTNDLKDAVVTATLPQGVVWKNQVSPSSENIKYDSDSRTVSWSVGNVSSGVGYNTSPREVSFQVGLTPSLNQVGQVPQLTSQVSISADDSYTEKSITASTQPVTTRYSDPSFASPKDVVAR